MVLGCLVEIRAGEEQVRVGAEVVSLMLLQQVLLVAVHKGLLAADCEVEEELVEDHEANLRW
jgi:hypothetical protein